MAKRSARIPLPQPIMGPARLSADDLATHTATMMQVNMLHGQAEAVRQTWLRIISEKYGMPDGSRVDADGILHRVSVPDGMPGAAAQNGHHEEAIPGDEVARA